MIPTGPSPCTKGIRFSSSSANMRSGREKASVFPDPVKAIPIMSRPEKLRGGLLAGISEQKQAGNSRDGESLKLNRRRRHDLLVLEVVEERLW